MTRRLKYVKRPSQAVAAVQLAVDTKGFTYKKWGSVQRCRARDWIVDNEGDVYTVNRGVVSTDVSPGRSRQVCEEDAGMG
jgi:hypothetical protein